MTADRFPSLTGVPWGLSALRPGVKELFIASKSPAAQIQRMELGNRGGQSERAESQRARKGFKRVQIFLTFKLCRGSHCFDL